MNIFIGGLPFQMTETDLEETFSEYGTVQSAKLILDKVTGKSKGFGFIEMPDAEEAKKAIQELDGIEIYGRKIGVKEAEERSDNRRPGGGGGGFNRNNGRSDFKKRY